jgi:hypothetical protein
MRQRRDAHLGHEEMNQLPRFLGVEQALSETCRWQIHDDLSAADRKKGRVRSEAALAGGTFGAGSAEPVAVPNDAFHSSQGPSIRSFPTPVFADVTAANRLTCWGSFPFGRPFSRAFGQAPVSLQIGGWTRFESSSDLARPIEVHDLCASFPRSTTRRDSTFPRESASGPLSLFPAFPSRVRRGPGQFVSLHLTHSLKATLRTESPYASPIQTRHDADCSRHLL